MLNVEVSMIKLEGADDKAFQLRIVRNLTVRLLWMWLVLGELLELVLLQLLPSLMPTV